MDTSRKIQVSKVIGAPAEDIFAVLADPNRHTEVDGNGMVQGPEGDSPPLGGIGQVFVMRMHRPELGDYRMVNSVTAFVPGARIGWAPTLDPDCEAAAKLGDMEATGHTYTFDLRPVDGGTEVTETYEWMAVKDERFAVLLPLVSAEQLESGLDKLAAAVG
ncbi:SRPBCC family protein [Pseudonocardia sp.]|uniref:SRPBCC family protein n=1 Tax=Pseudonocardia sp. TaxID=60912 RepID=UPI003D10D380